MDYYPIYELGPLMKGLLIGGVGIFHVFLAQFAIGSGMVMTYLEWLDGRESVPAIRPFLRGFFTLLVLVSFVAGAVTGVGMWIVAIQVSPRTIGLMVDEFHWVWAIEWTFFAVEVVCGYLYYRNAEILERPERIKLLLAYSVAGWFSLFWINGILSWQLTPGAWVETQNIWAGFFNPSFFPSLLFRTIAALTIAALVASAVVNALRVSRDEQAQLLQKISYFFLPMLLMPLVGAWYVAVLPVDSRAWLMGGSPAMSLFFGVSVGASVLVGAYTLIAVRLRRLFFNGATATLLVGLAFGATAGGEFVREGSRKPYTVRERLYSNSIAPKEISRLRREGSVADDPFPVRNANAYPTGQLKMGRKVYRLQCSVCHTVSGVNGLVHLTQSWDAEQARMNIAKLQHTKAFMPPFAGPASEVEALVQYLRWEVAGRPSHWPDPSDEALPQISRWLADAPPEGATHAR